MAESVKEILLNKISDEIMNLVIGMSKTELENFINQNKRQKILLHCIERFAASDFYKNEFRTTSYEPNNSLVISLDENLMDASLSSEQLKENLAPTIKILFVCDDGQDNNRISEFITAQYIVQAKATLQLYDILVVQRNNFDSLDSSIGEIKGLLSESERKARFLEAEKQRLIKTELSNEYNQILSRIMLLFLQLLHKKMPDLVGVNPNDNNSLLSALFNKTQETVQQVEQYINSDFVMTPVLCSVAENLKFREISINYFKYSELYFKREVIEKTDILLSYQNWLDIETVVLILRLRNILKGNMFVDIYQMGQSAIAENGQRIEIDVNFFRKTLYALGDTIICLYRKLIEQ